MHITKFVIHVTKFVTHVRNFVTNFFCADSKKYQAERVNYLPDNKKGRHKILIVPGQSLFSGFTSPRFSPFREHKTRPGLKDLDFFKKFSVKYNTVEWENGADFAPEYLLELPEA